MPSIIQEQPIDPDFKSDMWEALRKYLKMGKREAVFCVDPDCFRGPTSHKSSMGGGFPRMEQAAPTRQMSLVTSEHTLPLWSHVSECGGFVHCL